MSSATNAALVTPWKDLWNGDLAIADRLIAQNFVAHAQPLTGAGSAEVGGRAPLKGWIAGIDAAFADLTFALQVGPIADENYLVVRWEARGTYRGVLPGAAPEALGRGLTFTGTDILLVRDGTLVEYWANADSLFFFQHLGISTVPPLQ